jgi:membrane protein
VSDLHHGVENGSTDPGARATARAHQVLGRLPTRLQPPITWLLERWPGRIVLGTADATVRIGLFDRAMTVSAQFFTSVLPLLILFATWRTARDTRWVAGAVSLPAETRQVLDDAVEGANGAAFGLVGTVMVLVSATSLSRALTRVFADIWHLPRPRNDLRSAWRWVAVVIAIALSLVLVRALLSAVGELPPPQVWRTVISLVCDLIFGVFVPWMLLVGSVRPRLLVPGAMLYAVTMLAFRPASAVWLPRALDTSEDRYGALGVSFTYLAWLYGASLILLAAAMVGQVVATDPGRIGQLIRGTAEPRIDQPEPGSRE